MFGENKTKKSLIKYLKITFSTVFMILVSLLFINRFSQKSLAQTEPANGQTQPSVVLTKDTDFDGISDKAEIEIYKTDPTKI